MGGPKGLPILYFMNKSIVLDLDGVIADLGSAIDEALVSQGIPEYDYSSWIITDSNDEKAMSIFNNPIFWKNMKPYEDAWHQVNKWFSSGIDVYIVTARRCESAIKQTQPWLDLWRINTMTPIFANINEKHSIVKNLNAKFVVEDNPHEVKILINEGINAFLRKQWYNEKYWNELPTIDNLYDLDWN